MLGYFWHGVGRSLYFLPLFFVPGLLSPWLAIERDAPYELRCQHDRRPCLGHDDRQRSPTRADGKLHRMHGEHVSRTPGFTNGLMSTLIMGIDITPNDTYIMEFLDTGRGVQTHAWSSYGTHWLRSRRERLCTASIPFCRSTNVWRGFSVSRIAIGAGRAARAGGSPY